MSAEADHDGNALADMMREVLPEKRIAAFFVVDGGVVDEQGVLVNLDGRVLREAPDDALFSWMLGSG